MKAFIPRDAADILEEYGKYFPVLSLTGPRQAGKTTLLRQLYPDYKYVSFEDLNFRDRFNDDPAGFLDAYDRQVIFDEAQRVPELFSYLQRRVDEDRTPARFILSGSQNFLLHDGITQSLAGRVGIVRLMPLTLSELKADKLTAETPAQAIHHGFYPEMFQTDLPPEYFYPNYLSSYLERDVSNLVRESNMGQFRQLLSFCAANVGQSLDYSYYAKRLRLANPTIRRWIDHLVASYIIFTVGPYFDNFGKRLVKSPKLYFTDTGLACYLLQMTSPETVREANLYGALFENLVVANRYKERLHKGNQHPLYYFRDSNGVEVDLLGKRDNRLYLTEIKASQTPHGRFAGNLKKIAAASGEGESDLRVVYGGQEKVTMDGVSFIPWNEA